MDGRGTTAATRVIGVGIDVADVDRIAAASARRGARFADRVLHPGEREGVAGAIDPDVALAEAFALKEACLKALGTGWSSGVAFHQVERRGRRAGRSEIRLHGAARARAESLGVRSVSAAVSSARGVACALVILAGPGGDR